MAESGVLHSNASSPERRLAGLEYSQIQLQAHGYTAISAPPSSLPSASQATPVEPQNAGTYPSPDHRRGDMDEPLQQQDQQEVPAHSFYQRYFTKPVVPSTDTEKSLDSRRRFSFLSLGALLAAACIMLVLAAIIAAAVALSTDNDHHKLGHVEDNSRSPIRAAIPYNFPDPALWHVDGTWYAFATNNAAGVLPYTYAKDKHSNASKYTVNFGLANVQLATSTNFINWTTISLVDQPLPTTGKWSMPSAKNTTARHGSARIKLSNTWAPAVIRRSDGKFVMYYSASRGSAVRWADNKNHPHPHCIGAAVSKDDSALGPYDPEPEVLACPWRQGGAIDPEAFRDDDGTLYMLYKIDGNNVGSGGACGNTFKPIQKTPIMLQQMDEDGVTKVGDPIEILTNEKQDGPLVEAPMLVKSDEGIYFLFFSSGCTRDPSYAVEYATARNITGPYTRAEKRLLKSGDWGLEAPGSVGIAKDSEGSWMMAFHARVAYGDVGRVRGMFTTKLRLNGTKVEMIRDNSTVELKHHDRD